MKKVLLSLLAVAALVLSCQNYDDEFAALNAKVASLESQISSLSGLQTALTQVQSSVSALQAAVSAIPNLSSEVAAILADLSDLETAVAAATTSADLDALKSELNTTLAALQALIEANSADIAAVVVSNASLKSQLEALGVDVDAILATNATFEGSLTITNAAELAYAVSLGAKVKSIKGDVLIDLNSTNKLSATDVNAVTSLIENVVGDVTLKSYKESIDVSALKAVSGDYIVSGWDAMDDALASAGDILLDYAAPYSFPALAVAKKIVLVDNAKVAANTTTGVPAQTGVTSVDFLALTSATSIATDSGASIHSSGGSSHSSGGNISVSGSYTAGTLSFGSATSVIVGDVEVNSLTAAKATEVQLHFDGELTGNLSVTTVLATAVTIKASSATGTDTITIDQAATGTTTLLGKKFNGLVTTDAKVLVASAATEFDGGITAAAITTVDLPLVTTAGAITAASATSVVAPKLVAAGAINIKDGTSTAATSIEVASVSTANLSDLANVGTLVLNSQAADLDLTGAALLTSATITGKANTTDITISDTEDKLATLALGGKLGTVTVGTDGTDGLAKLTTFSTSGTIKTLEVFNAEALVSISMAHTEDAADGSSLSVKNNDKLTSLTTSFDRATGLTVTGNEKLASVDFSSFTTAPNDFVAGTAVSFTVTGNYKETGSGTSYTVTGMTGAYTGLTATTDEKFVQSGLATLKSYILLDTGVTATRKFTATIDLDYVVTAEKDQLSGVSDDSDNIDTLDEVKALFAE